MVNIQELIQQLDNGSQNAQNADNIGSSLGLDPKRTAEPTRDLVRKAILEKSIPIGSNNNGYFLIDSKDELKTVVSSLQSRIDGLQERINSLKQGWQQRQKSRQNDGDWPK